MTKLKLKPVAAVIGILLFGTLLLPNSSAQTAADRREKAFPINTFTDKTQQPEELFVEPAFVPDVIDRAEKRPDVPPVFQRKRHFKTFENYEKDRIDQMFADGEIENEELPPVEPKPFDVRKINADPPPLGRSSGRWVIPDGATEYGVEFGYAPDIATWMSGPKYYDINDRGHILGAVRWGKILGTRAFVTYSWAVEIIPLNVALNNEVDNPNYLEGSVGEPPRNREHTWGVGINPASFRFIFFPQYRLRPQLGAGFGIVRHYSRVPTVEGTKMNFQVDFQIGGQYMLKENKALNFGYRYYHFSNLYLFNFNPGYNVNMFFVGYSVFK